MAITTPSSREFNQDSSLGRQQGKPTDVPLSVEASCRLGSGHQKIADLLAMPGVEEIELPASHPRDLPHPPDFA